ncbi:MAG: zinc ribbon domain-containing protein, partial [Clostridia bacterium]|nr:zinc ribbon domain-containing protein [Clostridia bacterium]
PIYIGVLQNGDARSEEIQELKIVETEIFQQAQLIMQGRTNQHSDVPLNLKGKALFSGKVYCGHCGNRLTLTTSGRKKTNKDGVIIHELRPRYQCHYKVRHPGECNGQSGYGVVKLDSVLDKVVRMQLERIKNAPCLDLIKTQHEKNIELACARYKTIGRQLKEKETELMDYQSEILKIIRGKSSFNADILNELMEHTKSEVESLAAAERSALEEFERVKTNSEAESKEFSGLLSWADAYDRCSLESKKMFIAYFVKSVHVYKDYKIHVEFNVSFEEFQNFNTNSA